MGFRKLLFSTKNTQNNVKSNGIFSGKKIGPRF